MKDFRQERQRLGTTWRARPRLRLNSQWQLHGGLKKNIFVRNLLHRANLGTPLHDARFWQCRRASSRPITELGSPRGRRQLGQHPFL